MFVLPRAVPFPAGSVLGVGTPRGREAGLVNSLYPPLRLFPALFPSISSLSSIHSVIRSFMHSFIKQAHVVLFVKYFIFSCTGS